MGLRYNSPILLGGGIALSAAFLAIIGWGQLKKDVDVPTTGYMTEPITICVDTKINGLDVNKALTTWRAIGYHITMDCSSSTKITVQEDPTVDTRGSVDDLVETHAVAKPSLNPRTGIIEKCLIRTMPKAGALPLAHELGHCLGYQHARFAPSGHLMHPHRIGWDVRGIEKLPAQ